MMEHQPAEPTHRYVFDPESATEMARLLLQGRLITEGMQGVFPERSDLSTIHTILDVGCGPGEWTLEVAQSYPDRTVVGVDISTTAIAYAQAQASAQGLLNASFSVMNALEPFTFAEETFDLVNVRFAAGWLLRAQWPLFLQRCLQVLRPGGILRLTEPEASGLTNSPALEELRSWFFQLLHIKGYGFSHDGSHVGILPMLGLLLQEAGCVNIQLKPHMLDFSMGTTLHKSQYENYKIVYLQSRLGLVHEGICTEDKFDAFYKLLLEEVQLPHFRGLWSLLTVWGEKPG